MLFLSPMHDHFFTEGIKLKCFKIKSFFSSKQRHHFPSSHKKTSKMHVGRELLTNFANEGEGKMSVRREEPFRLPAVRSEKKVGRKIHHSLGKIRYSTIVPRNYLRLFSFFFVGKGFGEKLCPPLRLVSDRIA